MTAEDSANRADAVDPQSATARLRGALKASASALKAREIPFALAGSYALWVHGAPENTHDVDLVVPEEDVEAAADCLARQGFAIERPPEDWLFKAHQDDAMVDVLHRLNGVPVTPAQLLQVPFHDVLGLHIPVMAPSQVVSTKLQSLSERYCDFGRLLPAVRAVREQLDWGQLRSDAKNNPYARAFLFLAGELDIAPPQ